MNYSKFDKITEDTKCGVSSSVLQRLSTLVIKTTELTSLLQSISPPPPVIAIGEASHGTHDFYQYRSDLTKSLILSGNINAIAIEGDFPDAALVNNYVLGYNAPDDEPIDPLSQFERFPSFMWGNTDTLDFINWLKNHNAQQADPKNRTSFWGMDVYSLHKSIASTLSYMKENDGEVAEQVKSDYACFDHFGDDTAVYGLIVSKGYKGCADAVQSALSLVSAKSEVDSKKASELYQSRINLSKLNIGSKESPQDSTATAAIDHMRSVDASFCAKVNAEVVVDAEQYYLAMYDPTVSSWNLRDTHFFEVLEQVRDHLKETRGEGNDKVAVWAHNSHIGDARYTHLDSLSGTKDRDINIGQLLKENIPSSILIGQMTSTGTVLASSDWGGKHEIKTVRPPLPSSYEELLLLLSKKAKLTDYVLPISFNLEVTKALDDTGTRIERAIGVIYRPETERQSHYYECDLARQFDFVRFVEISKAVVPLADVEEVGEEGVGETFPTGFEGVYAAGENVLILYG